MKALPSPEGLKKAHGRSAAAPEESDPRRQRLLDAALATFLRYGYRKTSMDEVARAAHISRQGLYLHFATKEELFHAALHHALATALESASKALADGRKPLQEKLVDAFDAWVGRYVGAFAGDVADLEEANDTHGGTLLADYEASFVDAVAKSLRATELPAAYKPAGITPRQLAETLQATARGLKHGCTTRADFAERFRVAARALCAPLRGAR